MPCDNLKTVNLCNDHLNEKHRATPANFIFVIFVTVDATLRLGKESSLFTLKAKSVALRFVEGLRISKCFILTFLLVCMAAAPVFVPLCMC